MTLQNQQKQVIPLFVDNKWMKQLTSVVPLIRESGVHSPALLTQTWILPKFSLMKANIDKISSSFVTSHRKGDISPGPALLRLAAICFSLSSFLAQAITFNPDFTSFVAMDCPMPAEAPVTRAILFAHLSILIINYISVKFAVLC